MHRPIVLHRGHASVAVLADAGAALVDWVVDGHSLLAGHGDARGGVDGAVGGARVVFPFADHPVSKILSGVPWEVTLVATDEVRLELDFAATHRLFEWFPHPCLLRMDVVLKAESLCVELQIENDGRAAIPFGFGLRSTFGLPLSSRGSRASTQVYVPQGGDVAAIVDPVGGRSISIEAPREDGFRKWQCLAPHGEDIVTLEASSFRAGAIGAPGLGLDELSPGASWTATAVLTAHGFAAQARTDAA